MNIKEYLIDERNNEFAIIIKINNHINHYFGMTQAFEFYKIEVKTKNVLSMHLKNDNAFLGVFRHETVVVFKNLEDVNVMIEKLKANDVMNKLLGNDSKPNTWTILPLKPKKD